MEAFVFGGRVYLKPDPSMDAAASSSYPLLNYYHTLSPNQQEGLSISLSALLLLGGFWAVVTLQQQPPSNSTQPDKQRFRLYSTAAPVFRPFFSKSNLEIHPVLQPAREEAEFSAELAMLGLRLNELVSDPNILFVVESTDEFASVCQKLAKSRQILRLAKTFDFSLELFSNHPLHWKSSLEDDFIIRASCAIPLPTTQGQLVDYEPGSRRIACLKRAMNRRVYDAALLRVLFLGMRTSHNTSFDELIEPTTHSSVEITNGVWQRFVLLLDHESDFVSCGLWFGSEPKAFERTVLRVSPTLSWAVVRAGGQLLLGDRGFTKLARYDVILDEDALRVYFNTKSVTAMERRELIQLLNRLPVINNHYPMESVDLFANRHWRICSTLPTTTTDMALHVVSTLKEAKRLLATRPNADLAIVVDDIIVVLQH